MSSMTSAQSASCDALSACGFEPVSNFFAGYDEDPDDNRRSYVFSKRINSYSTRQAQIESDGTVNGMTLDAYLASL